MFTKQKSKKSKIKRGIKVNSFAGANRMLASSMWPSVSDASILKRGSVMVADKISDEKAVLKSSEVVYHDTEPGRVVSRLVLDGVIEKTPFFSKTFISIMSGVAQLDLFDGVYFILNHNTDCTLSFKNIPSAGELCTIYVLRIKDDSNSVRKIFFGDEFINAPSGLTQKPLSRDLLTMRTNDGGISWIIGSIFDLREAVNDN